MPVILFLYAYKTILLSCIFFCFSFIYFTLLYFIFMLVLPLCVLSFFFFKIFNDFSASALFKTRARARLLILLLILSECKQLLFVLFIYKCLYFFDVFFCSTAAVFICPKVLLIFSTLRTTAAVLFLLSCAYNFILVARSLHRNELCYHILLLANSIYLLRVFLRYFVRALLALLRITIFLLQCGDFFATSTVCVCKFFYIDVLWVIKLNTRIGNAASTIFKTMHAALA